MSILDEKRLSYLMDKNRLKDVEGYVFSHFMSLLPPNANKEQLKELIDSPKDDIDYELAHSFFNMCDSLLINDSHIANPQSVKVGDTNAYAFVSKSMNAILELESKIIHNDELDILTSEISEKTKSVLQTIQNNIIEDDIDMFYELCSQAIILNTYFQDYIAKKYIETRYGINIDERHGFNLDDVLGELGNITLELKECKKAYIIALNFLFNDESNKERLNFKKENYIRFFNMFDRTIKALCDNRVLD